MAAHRPARSARALALAVALTVGLMAAPPAASASSSAAPRPANCPPDWLGTSTNLDPQISDDGRFVVFTAYVPDSETGDRMVFLRDVRRGHTTVASDPARPGVSFLPSMSADGNRISYLRVDSGMMGYPAEVWVYDRRTGARTLEGTADSEDRAALSADGRYLTYDRINARDSGLVDIVVRDVDRNITTLVSANPSGEPANDTSRFPLISADGRFVLFWSPATDLTRDAGLTSADGRAFVRDVRAGRTTLVPLPAGQSSGYQSGGRLSATGRFVLYANDTGAWRYDRRTGRSVRASTWPVPGSWVGSEGISATGRRVLLTTEDALLVRDVRSGRETAVDARPDGSLDPTTRSYPGGLTADGRYAVFYTETPDLDPHETAASWLSIYVRDTLRGTTRLVSSVHPGGACG